MRQILFRAVLLLGSWAVGLLVAAWVITGVSLSVSGFIVAVVVFSVAQAPRSLLILKLPHGYASLLLGGTGLALTIVALSLASLSTHGLTIRGIASWLATTVVVWLGTTVGAISLPELFPRHAAGSTWPTPGGGTPEPCNLATPCKFGYPLGAARAIRSNARDAAGPRLFDEVY